jgi:hypothetical protein
MASVMREVLVGLAVGALVLTGCSSSDNQSAPKSTSSAPVQASKAAADHAAAVVRGNKQAQAAIKAKAAAKAAHTLAVAHAKALVHAKAVSHAKEVAHQSAVAHAQALAKQAKVDAATAQQKAAQQKAAQQAQAVADAKAAKRAKQTDSNPLANCVLHKQVPTSVPFCTDSQIRASERWQLKKQGASQWYIDHHPTCPLSGCILPSQQAPLVDRARTNDITPSEGRLIINCNNGTYSLSSRKCAGVPRPGFD